MSRDAELRALLKSMRRIARAVDIQSRRIDREIGLTLPQLVVLTCVRDLGEVTGRAVSEEADLSPATVVGILDKLDAKRLIERYRSTTDRRVVHTRLTAAGAAVLERAPEPLGPAFDRAFRGLDAEVRQQILEAFGRVAELAAPGRGSEWSAPDAADERDHAGPAGAARS
jgi:DNA-binding MarR family transcriptional regulator